MRESTRAKAIKLMAEAIVDENFLAKLKSKPPWLIAFLEMVFDRCGVPKMVQVEGGTEGNASLASAVAGAIVGARAAGLLPKREE